MQVFFCMCSIPNDFVCVQRVGSELQSVVVFPGECLQRVTRGLVAATPHRVAIPLRKSKDEASPPTTATTATTASTRLSMPFELFLHPSTIIDIPVDLALCPSLSDIDAPARSLPPASSPLLTSEQFISMSSANLMSVNRVSQ
jgi:isopenicillin N synthase-like dioxygenase